MCFIATFVAAPFPAALIAESTNLGLTRMADICGVHHVWGHDLKMLRIFGQLESARTATFRSKFSLIAKAQAMVAPQSCAISITSLTMLSAAAAAVGQKRPTPRLRRVYAELVKGGARGEARWTSSLACA
jgi:hypothetical protein